MSLSDKRQKALDSEPICSMDCFIYYEEDLKQAIKELKEDIYECNDIGYENGVLYGMILAVIDKVFGDDLT